MDRMAPFIGRAAMLNLLEALAAEPGELDATERERLQRLVTTLARGAGNGPTAKLLRVHDDVRWFEVQGGERVSLQRRGPVRLLFKALLARHQEVPGRATTLTELFAAGWPGQRTTHASGAARVYVALATLRRLGLRPLLQTRDDGYLINPSVAVQIQKD